MHEAIKLGHTITHDWTTFEGEGMEKMKLSAEKDIKAIQECNVLVAFLTDPKYAYRGTYTELGASLALNKKTIIVSSCDQQAYYRSNCFYHHPNIIHVESWNEAILLLKAIPSEFTF
jgi:nucleoside 2-deoxyribosyltransferase